MNTEELATAAAVTSPDNGVDPDPFMIGIGIFGCIAGGGAFLEARRTRQLNESQMRGEFRKAWFTATRTVIHFKRAVDEFETYVMEDRYGTKNFRIGAVRLVVDAGRKQSMRRLKGQTFTTANRLADDLDDLSEHLGPEYAEAIQELIDKLGQVTFPESYRELLRTARDAINLYSDLLEDIGQREQFEPSDPSETT